MQINTNFTISNFFIIISAFFLALNIFFPELNIYNILALHSYYFEAEKYLMIPFQMIFANFLHADIFHLLFNSVFIFIF